MKTTAHICAVILCLAPILLPPPAAQARSEKDRLPFSHVRIGHQLNDFLQDRDGFIWIATVGAGLIRYDGYERKTFTKGPDSLSHNNIYTLFEDRKGLIWIGSAAGLDRYDKETNTFQHFAHDPDDPATICAGTVLAIAEDRRGALWVGSFTDGLSTYNPETGTFRRFPYALGKPGGPAGNRVNAILEDRSGNMWIGSDEGLCRYDREEDAFDRHRHDPADPCSISGNHVTALAEDHDGALWVGTAQNGLCRFNPKTGVFKRYAHAADDAGSIGSNHIRRLFTDHSGTLWVGTFGGGLNKYRPETDDFKRYQADAQDPGSLSTNDVEDIHEGPSGMLWVMLLSGELERYDPYKKPFRLYRNDPADPKSLSSNIVVPIYEDRRGAVWLGTGTGGLNRFNRIDETFTRYLPDPDDPASVDHPFVSVMFEDSAGNFWISASNLAEADLAVFDRDAGKCVRRYRHDPEDPESLAKCSVIRDIVEDRNNPDILWIAVNEVGFEKFEKSGNRFTHFFANPDDPDGLRGGYVWDIHQDAAGALWLATLQGLNRFDPETETFTHFQHDPDDDQSLSSDEALSIHEDRHGRLWVGTQGGLNRFNPDAGTFVRFTTENGLPDNTIFGILEDDDGFLWLSTNKGLVKFAPDAGAVRTYTRSDGLQGDAFFFTSCCRTRDGEMWFGGFNGVNRFDPADIRDNPCAPPVVLTSFRQGGQPVRFEKALERLKTIRLDWRANFFEFEFAALSYAQPEKNQYQYILEGFDKTWSSPGTRRFGRYTNLPPGNYRLRLKGSNNDGVWNENGRVVNIIVAPPFWRTGAFYAAVAIAALFLIIFTALNIRRLKSEIRERKAAEKRHLEHLRFLENMERIDRAVLQSKDLENMLEKVIQVTFDIFQCDRAWLLFPCNPDAPSFRIPMESNNPQYPGAKLLNLDVPMTQPMADDCRAALNSEAPVTFDPASGRKVSEDTARAFSVQSQIFMALHPRIGDAWMFGMHQCAWARVWTEEEKTMFLRIGRRMTDALSSFLFLRQLEESEERLRQLSDGAWEAIAIHDQGILLEANRQYYDMFGYEPDELLGRQAMEKTTSPSSLAYLAEQVRVGNPGPYEAVCRRKDGSEFPVEIRAKAMEYHGKSVRMAAIRDITERKTAEAENRKLQEQLLRSKKMEAMGLMAGGVAHDLNNILSAIVGYPDILLDNPELSNAVRKGLETIKKSGERAAAVVSDLLTIARGVAVGKTTVNLNDIIRDYLRSPEHLSASGAHPAVSVALDLDGDLLNLKGSTIHLKKTLMNLIGNALEAVEGAGFVTIRTRNQYLDHPLRSYDRIHVGEYVVLSVADDGPGIDRADLERIFEPFYTRKVMGRSGTGLGLAVVWNVVHDHEAYIDVASEPAGTTFGIYFPAVRDKTDAAAEAIKKSSLRGHGQRILAVDDEEMQRDIISRMLTSLGYRVETAASGEEAVAHMRDHAADLIVLDMIMPPGINGRETYARIKALHPGQKAVIASGFAESEDVKQAQELGAGRFIQKPYTLEKLGAAVKAELEED